MEINTEKTYKLAKQKWGYVVISLNKLLQSPNETLNDVNSPLSKLMSNKVKKMLKDFELYMKQAVVLGWNCSAYDINLSKYTLFQELNMLNDVNSYAIKKCNRYICVSTSEFRILDCMNYMAANCSYEKFLKAYEVTGEKRKFCYEFLDSAEKLNYPRLPDYNDFFSTLKNRNVFDSYEEYQELQTEWNEKGWTKLSD